MKEKKKKYYFSNNLQTHIAEIMNYPLTIVEAPSGFGKTTAIREFLKNNLSSGAKDYWYTCYGESAAMAWSGFCELIAYANNNTAECLKILGTLGMSKTEALTYIMSVIRDFDCQTETYLIVDNYHLVDCGIHSELLNVLSMHKSKNIHMIFITQYMENELKFLINNINIIKASEFLLNRQEVAALFRREGIKLSNDEIGKVHKFTDGWIAALRLQITCYKETGLFKYTTDLDQLIEVAIWDRLKSDEKYFLLVISVLDSFTLRQAAAMLGEVTLTKNIYHLLRNNDFIRLLPDKGIYAVHSILQRYLRNQFNSQSLEFQKEVFHSAGHVCAADCQYYEAVRYFYILKDFDAIMSLPVTHQYFNWIKEICPQEHPSKLVLECPEDIMRKNPIKLLMFGLRMIIDRQSEAYRKICRVVESVIQNKIGHSEEELREIEGEYLFLKSFEDATDIRKMHAMQEKAWEILGRASIVISMDFPFASGSTSLLSSHWCEVGCLEDMTRSMDEHFSCYLKLTLGHGAGADSVFKSEILLMQGEDVDAEILCHRAIFDAQAYNQVEICICAELVLARIAILRGNVQDYLETIERIKKYAISPKNLHVLRMVDISISNLSLILGSTDDVADWLWDTEQIRQNVYSPIFPLTQVLNSKILLQEQSYNKLYGISQSCIDTSRDLRYLMPQVYHLILLSVAKYKSGSSIEAQEYLAEALNLAFPDKIYLPFAQEESVIGILSEMTVSNDYSNQNVQPMVIRNALSIEYAQHINDLKELCNRQQKGMRIIKKAMVQKKSPLTPREWEIAQLAKDRMSAKEIAEKLYIAESTVRSNLKIIYSKLDIHSKSELVSVDF